MTWPVTALFILLALVQPGTAAACLVPYHGDRYDSVITLRVSDEPGDVEAVFPWKVDDLWVQSAALAYYDANDYDEVLAPLRFDELTVTGTNREATVRFRPSFRPNERVALRVTWDVAPWVVGGCSATGQVFFNEAGERLAR